MKESQVIDTLAALSHETRLRIIRHLVVKGETGDSAGAIGKKVAAAPSKVTFHVSALERAGLVSSTRVSRQIMYTVNFDQLGRVLNYLIRDCCKSNAAVLACCGVSDDRNCC